jgi:putative tryptophan/tyrosine transport system substrate-binding protein
MITRRRQVLILGAALAVPLPSRSQQSGSIRRIGFLASRSRSTPSSPDPYYDAFVDQMRKVGYVEGKDLAIEWRFADGKYERLPQLAAELVKASVEVIVTHSSPGTRAAQRATSVIPIVMIGVGDPVRPGGNITGLALLVTDLTTKQFELLKTVMPGVSRVAVLMNPANKTTMRQELKDIQGRARKLGVDVVVVNARTAAEIKTGFTRMTRQGAEALIITGDAYYAGQAGLLAELTLAHKLPSVGWYRDHVKAGVLMSYGTDTAFLYRAAAVFVDRILKGAKPGELAIEQPTKIHLAINRQTAKVLGVAIPPDLLLRANEVID